jgi:hypothetical protein
MERKPAMSILAIVKILCAVFTIGFGLYSVVAPRAIKGFTGLDANNSRGVTEVRAVMGGTFVGLGLAPLLLGSSAGAYQALGITYFAIATIRAVSMVVDKSVMSSNLISLASEIVLGILLVL